MFILYAFKQNLYLKCNQLLTSFQSIVNNIIEKRTKQTITYIFKGLKMCYFLEQIIINECWKHFQIFHI
jgi:hypothetical protein